MLGLGGMLSPPNANKQTFALHHQGAGQSFTQITHLLHYVSGVSGSTSRYMSLSRFSADITTEMQAK